MSTKCLIYINDIVNLTLWWANDTIGIIQKLPIGGLMMQCVSSIQKFAKNRVILWLYSCFVTYMHKKLWDLTRMHRLWVVPAWVQPLATDSPMLSAIVCGAMRVAALSIWCLAFFLQDFCQYIIYLHNIVHFLHCLHMEYIYLFCTKKNIFHMNFFFLTYYWLCC